MKKRSNLPTLVLSFILISYGCSKKSEESTVSDSLPNPSEEELGALESRVLELESQLAKLDEKLIAKNLQIDTPSSPTGPEVSTNKLDPKYIRIKEFIKSGSFAIKDDTVYYTGDIILDFGPKLRISSVGGRLLSDLKQSVFGGDMIVETKTEGGGTVFLNITDGYLERDGEEVHIDSKKPGTIRMEYMSNQAELTTPDASRPTS